MTALEVLGISKEELLKRELIAKPKPSASLPTLGNIMESLGWVRNALSIFKNPTESPDLGRAEKLMEDLQSSADSNPLMKQVSEAMKPWMSTDVMVDHDEGLIVVQGQQHFYRVHLSDGKIERVTDNVELELDWENLPDELRETFGSERDSQHRCHLMAGFLQFDSLYGRYFQVKKV
jgi:hypothetical protein